MSGVFSYPFSTRKELTWVQISPIATEIESRKFYISHNLEFLGVPSQCIHFAIDYEVAMRTISGYVPSYNSKQAKVCCEAACQWFTV